MVTPLCPEGKERCGCDVTYTHIPTVFTVPCTFKCIAHVLDLFPSRPILQGRQLRPREGKCLPMIPEPLNGLQSYEAPSD